MTSVNVTISAEAAYVISDGIAIEPKSGAFFPMQKVLPIAHLNAVIACRGQHLLTTAMLHLLQLQPSFEVAAAGLGENLRTAVEACRTAGHWNDDSSEVFLVGWPPGSLSPQCWMADTHGRFGWPSYEARCFPGVTTSPLGGTERLQALCASPIDANDPAPIYWPERDGPELIEEFRELHGSNIGGFCQMTTITREDIATCILRRWPEHYDERVGP